MKFTLTLLLTFIVHCLSAQFVGLDDQYAGGDGISNPAFAGASNNSQSHHMIVDASNNSFHFGYTEIKGNLPMSCAKLDDLGNYAAGFGQSGQTVIGTEYAVTSLEGADFYANGKVLICGTFHDDAYPNIGGVVYRMNGNGTLDGTFANGLTGSYWQTGDANYNITAIGCSVFDNNKSIAAFTYEDPSVVSLMLTRYTAAGAEDPTFDNDGIYFVTLSDSLRVSDIKDDGTNMFLCGYYQGFDQKIGVVLKINQNGDFVSGFGNGAAAEIGNTSDEYQPQALYVTANGDIFVTGRATLNGAFVSKMDSSGDMDYTFGTNGIAFYSNVTNPIGLAISVTPDGKIMIAGKESDSEGIDHSFIAQFNADGTMDTSFDTDGIYYPDFGVDEDRIVSLHVLSDGDFLTTGFGHLTGGPDRYLCAKFHTSGVGVNEVSNRQPDMYPNPVTDELFIRTNDFNTSAIQITDCMGNIVLNTNISNSQTRINMSSFSSGIYHITITDSMGNRRVRSVVKG